MEFGQTPNQFDALSESLPENPEDRAKEAVEKAADDAGTFAEFNSELANQQQHLSEEDDYDSRYLVGKAKESEERATVGHQEQLLVDTEDMEEIAGQAPRVERSTASRVVEVEGEFEVAEEADRAALLEKMQIEYFGSVVDPVKGTIIEQQTLQNGFLRSAMDKQYQGGVRKENSEYNEQRGADFIDAYGGAEAFYDFLLGSGEHAGDRVALQVYLIKYSKIDTSEKYIKKIGHKAGFDKSEMEELMKAFTKEDDPMEEADPYEEDDPEEYFNEDDFAVA